MGYIIGITLIFFVLLCIKELIKEYKSYISKKKADERIKETWIERTLYGDGSICFRVYHYNEVYLDPILGSPVYSIKKAIESEERLKKLIESRKVIKQEEIDRNNYFHLEGE